MTLTQREKIVSNFAYGVSTVFTALLLSFVYIILPKALWLLIPTYLTVGAGYLLTAIKQFKRLKYTKSKNIAPEGGKN